MKALNITQKNSRSAIEDYLVNLTIQNVQPPEEVQAAFSDAIKAAQDAEKTKMKGRLTPMMLSLEQAQLFAWLKRLRAIRKGNCYCGGR